MKMPRINVTMTLLMVVGIGLVLYGVVTAFDVGATSTASSIAKAASEGFFTQHRVLALVLIVVGGSGIAYALLATEGLFSKHFSDR
jgi:hypothetical protein